MIRRLLKWASIGFFAGLITLLVLGSLLLSTQWGFRVVVNIAQPYLPAALTIDSVGGTLLSQVRLDGIEWLDDGVLVRIGSVDAEIGLGELLKRSVAIRSANVQRVDVTVTDSKKEKKESTQEFRSPVDLSVANLVVTDINFESGDFKRNVESVKLSAILSGSILNIENFAIIYNELSADAKGQLNLTKTFSRQLSFSWEYRVSPSDVLAGDGNVSGQGMVFDLEHRLTSPYAVASGGTLRWQGSLGFDISNTWEDLTLAVQDREVRSREGKLHLAGTLENYDFELDGVAILEPIAESSFHIVGAGDTQTIRVSGAELVTPNGRAVLDGSTTIAKNGARWDGQLRIEDLETQFIRLDLPGYLNLDLQTNGAIENWDRISATVKIHEFAGELKGHALSGSGALTVAGRQLNLSELILNAGKNKFIVNGGVGETLDVKVTFDAQELSSLVPGFAGSAVGKLALSGKPESLIWEGDIKGRKLAYRDWATESVEILGSYGRPLDSVDIQARAVRIQNAQFESLSVQGTGSLESHSLSLDLHQQKGGKVEVSLEGKYQAQTWKGKFVSALASFAESEQWSLAAPAEFDFSKTKQIVSNFCLDGGGNRRVCADLNADGETTNAKINIESLPVGPLIEIVSPELSGKGRFSGDLELSRTNGNYSGEVSMALVDGAIEFNRFSNTEKAPDSKAAIKLDLALDGIVESNTLTLQGSADIANNGAAKLAASVMDIRDFESQLNAELDVGVQDLSFFVIDFSGCGCRSWCT